MEKINEYCSFSSEKGNWNFLKKIITYENQLFPITNDSIKIVKGIVKSPNQIAYDRRMHTTVSNSSSKHLCE